MAQSRYPVTRRGSNQPSLFGNWNDWMNRFTMPFPSLFEPTLTTGVIAPVDVCERDNEFIVRMACAGCRPEDIDVTVQDDTIRIRGQFFEHEMMGEGEGTCGQQMTQPTGQQAMQPTGQQMTQSAGQQGMTRGTQQSGQHMTQPEGPHERCLIRELPTGRFERDIVLPVGVNAQQAHAHFENGLLTLNLPKSPAAMGQRIQIDRGTSQSTSQNIGVGTR